MRRKVASVVVPSFQNVRGDTWIRPSHVGQPASSENPGGAEAAGRRYFVNVVSMIRPVAGSGSQLDE